MFSTRFLLRLPFPLELDAVDQVFIVALFYPLGVVLDFLVHLLYSRLVHQEVHSRHEAFDFLFENVSSLL